MINQKVFDKLFPGIKETWSPVDMNALYVKSQDEKKALDMKKPADQRALLNGLQFGGFGEDRAQLWHRFEDLSKGNGKMIHLGVDFSGMEAGQKVRSLTAGTVLHVWNDPTEFNGWGRRLIIRGAKSDVLYGHLDQTELVDFNVGDLIKEGDILGVVGNEACNGGWFRHLHLQCMRHDYTNAFGNDLKKLDGYDLRGILPAGLIDPLSLFVSFKSIGPYVPFPLWLAASSVWLVPYKMHLLSTLGANIPVPAFPELSIYMEDLPVMFSPSWWVAAHIITVSAFLLWAVCRGLVIPTHPTKQKQTRSLWYLHFIHSALVLFQYNKLSTAVPPWIAALINVGGTLVLFWTMPGSWKSDIPMEPTVHQSFYARWRSLPGNAIAYWTVFGIPWWLELVLIVRHIPATILPLSFYIGIWCFLYRFYFNRLHSHGHFDD